MKKYWFPFFFIMMLDTLNAQDLPPLIEQKIEFTLEEDETDSEKDSYLQQMTYYLQHPLNLNTATITELVNLRILSPLQIHHLINYRKLLGSLLSVYELQAIPLWDMATIRKLLPFVTVTVTGHIRERLFNRFTNGDHLWIGRMSYVLEPAAGFKKNTGSYYEGSRPHLMMRYRYKHRNDLQFGVVADKDAGEAFFNKSQKQGFDFYAAHLFAANLGIIQAVALGDYTVNMGQGLIQWQSLAFKKNSDVMGIKRQSAVLRPYTSAGEFYYNRGVGVTAKINQWELTGFASFKNQSASSRFDSLLNEPVITSVHTSGYHRTPTEIKNKNQLQQVSFGGNIRYSKAGWHLGLNAVYFMFDKYLQKRNEPFNLFAIQGRSWMNQSIDYSYTRNNFHLFGEAAMDKYRHTAYINGLMVSLNSKADFSILHRHITKGYQSVNGNAFTENTMPVNESGLYAGLTIRLTQQIKMGMYADVFSFPWLKYLSDAPGKGREYLVQFSYSPNRDIDIYTRYKAETKTSNQKDNSTVTNYLVPVTRQQWRVHWSAKLNKQVTLRQRTELSWFKVPGQPLKEGFLSYVDVLYKPMMKKLGAGLRLQYVDTDDYDTRIYAYENDVLYSYTVPPFFGSAFRYYLNAGYDASKKISCFLRFAQSIYINQQEIGTGNDAINGSRKTEIKIQTVVRF